MPPKKRSQKREEDASSSEEEANTSTEEIDVEFEAYGICEKDLDGIVTLLKHSFSGEEIDVNELGQILTSQNGRGCIFMTAEDNTSSSEKQSLNEDEDNEIYGVVSYIDLHDHKNKSCVGQLKSIIEKYNASNSDKSSREKIADFLQKIDNQPVAFIINERLLNLPYHISLPAFQGLSKELESSKINYEGFLMILKTQQIKTGANTTINNQGKTTKKGKKRKKRPEDETSNENGEFFMNPEEEFIAEESKISLDYDAPNEEFGSTSDSGIKSRRKIVIFDRLALNRFLQKLSNDVAGSVDC